MILLLLRCEFSYPFVLFGFGVFCGIALTRSRARNFMGGMGGGPGGAGRGSGGSS